MTEPVRILVVDPQEDEAKPCLEALEDRGWLADYAQRFSDAVALVERSFYNVVIMDVVLPDLLGTEAWRHLKLMRPEMACILTTASSSLREGVDAYSLDVMDFSLKPLRMDAVCNLISQICRHQETTAGKSQREQELNGIAAWLAAILKAPTRHQIFDTSIAHLEVILPAQWMAAYFSPDRQLEWTSRSTSGLQLSSPWAGEQKAFLEETVRQTMETGILIIPSPSTDEEADPHRPPIKSLISVPLTVESRNHGVLIFMKEHVQGVSLPKVETEFAIVFGRTLTLALDRVQIAKQVRSLPLATHLTSAPTEA